MKNHAFLEKGFLMSTRTLKKIVLLSFLCLIAAQVAAFGGWSFGVGFGGPRYYASYDGPWYNRWGWDGPGYWGHRRYDDGAVVAASGLVGLAAGAAIASAAQPKDPAVALQEYEDRKMLQEQREKDRELKRKEKEEKRLAKEEELAQKRHEREKRKRKREEEEQARKEERANKHTKIKRENQDPEDEK